MWYGRTTVPKSTSYIGQRSCHFDGHQMTSLKDWKWAFLLLWHHHHWRHNVWPCYWSCHRVTTWNGRCFASEKQVCIVYFWMTVEVSLCIVYMCVLLTNETYSMHWHPLRYSVYTYFCVRRCYIVMQMSAKLCTVLSLDEWMDRHVCL